MKRETIKQNIFSSRYGEEELSLAFKPLDEHIEILGIKALWRGVPALRAILQNLAQKITNNYTHIQDVSSSRDYNYKEELINSILNFIQNLSIYTIGGTIGGKETLEDVMNDDYNLPKDKVLILTYQIERLEKLIDRLDTISPIESFIYTEIIKGATEYLGTIEDTEDAREFDLGGYITKDADLEGLNLSGILENLKQKSYFLEEYQLLQRDHPHRITETIQMREQEDDHISVNLRLAQSLRTRSIDPVETHIPEFADLIDEHIAYIRKGVIESQKFSDSEKTERLELLDAMQSKAQAYKDSEQMTYLKWLNLNLHFAMIVTASSDLLKDNYEESYPFPFVFKKSEGDIDFEFIKEWMINDDGLDIFKIAGIFKIFDYFRVPDHKDNENAINRIASDIGLNLKFDDIRRLDVELEDDALLLSELARRLNLELKSSFFDRYMVKDGVLSESEFYNVNRLGSFVYIFNRFPERIMIPTIYDLEMNDINKTYGYGVHLIGLNNDYMDADATLMSPFEFILHDVSHSVNHHNDDHLAGGYGSYADSHIQLEKFPEPLKSFMKASYFELTHEDGAELSELIESYQQQQRQIIFSFVQKLGDRTASEELEFKKAILLFTYFKFIKLGVDSHIVNIAASTLNEGMGFTEENIKDTDTFVKLVLRLYMLYAEQPTLSSN